jgi:hypothetical protein
MRRTLQALSAAAPQRRFRNCSKLFVLVDFSGGMDYQFGSRHSGLSSDLSSSANDTKLPWSNLRVRSVFPRRSLLARSFRGPADMPVGQAVGQ